MYIIDKQFYVKQTSFTPYFLLEWPTMYVLRNTRSCVPCLSGQHIKVWQTDSGKVVPVCQPAHMSDTKRQKEAETEINVDTHHPWLTSAVPWQLFFFAHKKMSDVYLTYM